MSVRVPNSMRSAPGSLPTSLRVLHITSRDRPTARLAEALADDGACRVALAAAVGPSAGAARLREEPWEAVLIQHRPDELDAVELVAGLRGAGCEEPLVVLCDDADDELAVLCHEAGADACVAIRGCMTRKLLWTLARAVERQQLIRENRRLEETQRRRVHQDRHEAERLLADQRAVAHDLGPHAESTSGAPAVGLPDGRAAMQDDVLAPELARHYGELLRAYVVMGSGNLSGEMKELAGLLAVAGLSARQTMELHLLVVEQMIQGLGSRSGRHVMTRADLLILEVMVHLAENYRDAYRQCLAGLAQTPPAQTLVPHFDEAA